MNRLAVILLVTSCSAAATAEDGTWSNRMALAKEYMATRQEKLLPGSTNVTADASVVAACREMAPILLENGARVFAAHFTESELRDLLRKADSPAKEKLRRLRPVLLRELDEMSDRFVDEHVEVDVSGSNVQIRVPNTAAQPPNAPYSSPAAGSKR